MFGSKKPKIEPLAPLSVKLELWPAAMKGRATIVRDGGRPHELEISAPYMRLVMSIITALR